MLLNENPCNSGQPDQNNNEIEEIVTHTEVQCGPIEHSPHSPKKTECTHCKNHMYM